MFVTLALVTVKPGVKRVLAVLSTVSLWGMNANQCNVLLSDKISGCASVTECE